MSEMSSGQKGDLAFKIICGVIAAILTVMGNLTLSHTRDTGNTLIEIQNMLNSVDKQASLTQLEVDTIRSSVLHDRDISDRKMELLDKKIEMVTRNLSDKSKEISDVKMTLEVLKEKVKK